MHIHFADAVTLPMALGFFTGAEEMPPLGFPHEPTLVFSDTNPYPTALTCAIQLTLPTKYNTYAEFRRSMSYAMVVLVYLNHLLCDDLNC